MIMIMIVIMIMIIIMMMIMLLLLLLLLLIIIIMIIMLRIIIAGGRRRRACGPPSRPCPSWWCCQARASPLGKDNTLTCLSFLLLLLLLLLLITLLIMIIMLVITILDNYIFRAPGRKSATPTSAADECPITRDKLNWRLTAQKPDAVERAVGRSPRWGLADLSLSLSLFRTDRVQHAAAPSHARVTSATLPGLFGARSTGLPRGSSFAAVFGSRPGGGRLVRPSDVDEGARVSRGTRLRTSKSPTCGNELRVRSKHVIRKQLTRVRPAVQPSLGCSARVARPSDGFARVPPAGVLGPLRAHVCRTES